MYLHDGDGRRIGEFGDAWANRTYATMEPQRAIVTVPEDDPLLLECTSDDRIIVIESDLYPVVWAGPLLGTTGRPDAGAIDLDARGYETILQRRYLPTNFAPTGTAGAVFAALHEAVESSNPAGVQLATTGIATGDPFENTNYGDLSLYDAWQRVAQGTRYEWWLEHQVARGQLSTSAHFQPARGFERNVTLSANGPRPNLHVLNWRNGFENTIHRLRAIAGATTAQEAFSERLRVERKASDSGPLLAAQRAAAGLLRHGVSFLKRPTGRTPLSRGELVVVLESVRGAGSLATAAESALLRGMGADRMLDLEVWGDPAIWPLVQPGDVIRVSAPPRTLIRGYEGPVAVVATQPMEHEGLLHLVVEVPSAN